MSHLGRELALEHPGELDLLLDVLDLLLVEGHHVLLLLHEQVQEYNLLNDIVLYGHDLGLNELATPARLSLIEAGNEVTLSIKVFTEIVQPVHATQVLHDP